MLFLFAVASNNIIEAFIYLLVWFYIPMDELKLKYEHKGILNYINGLFCILWFISTAKY